MRPAGRTPAHQTDLLAELVCSNSFKSIDTLNAHGLLKAELRLLGSVLLACADDHARMVQRLSSCTERCPGLRSIRFPLG